MVSFYGAISFGIFLKRVFEIIQIIIIILHCKVKTTLPCKEIQLRRKTESNDWVLCFIHAALLVVLHNNFGMFEGNVTVKLDFFTQYHCSVSRVCRFDMQHIFRILPHHTHPHRARFIVLLSLSGSPCRLPPGSAGQLSARLYILHPGHLCVCGSALHPRKRKAVHHLWHLSVHCLWVFSVSQTWFLSVCHPLTYTFNNCYFYLLLSWLWCPRFLLFSPGLCIMIAASIYTDRFHLDEKYGWYGHCFILAWISFALTFISSIIYFVLRKKTAWEGH